MRAAQAFILASVLAVLLPMPQYARDLSHEAYVVWLMRLMWVLMLTVGVGAVILLVGALADKRRRKNDD